MNWISILAGCLVAFHSMAIASFQPVDVNNASKEQLMALPGVGEKLARRVIEHRQRKGLFIQVDDLLQVPGFKQKLLDKLEGKIVVGRGARFAAPAARKKEIVLERSKEIEVTRPQPTLSDEDIAGLMQEFADEPKVREVQERALAYANAHPAQVTSWLSRVRRAAWAPKVGTSGGRELDTGRSTRERVGDADIFYRRDSADWRFDIKAEWKFSDVVFNRDELSVARESSQLSMLRHRIIESVTHKYFDRRRLQVEGEIVPDVDAQTKVSRQIKIEQLTAEIDGFTGGWFSERLGAS